MHLQQSDLGEKLVESVGCNDDDVTESSSSEFLAPRDESEVKLIENTPDSFFKLTSLFGGTSAETTRRVDDVDIYKRVCGLSKVSFPAGFFETLSAQDRHARLTHVNVTISCSPTGDYPLLLSEFLPDPILDAEDLSTWMKVGFEKEEKKMQTYAFFSCDDTHSKPSQNKNSYTRYTTGFSKRINACTGRN